MDSSLSVDLSNPEWWVKILLESASVSLIEKRIPGPGGLPTGAQGDVLVQLQTEEDAMSSFLIMRRGSRIIPILDSKPEFVSLLSKWDPFLGVRSRTKYESGQMFQRPAWEWLVSHLNKLSHTFNDEKPQLKRHLCPRSNLSVGGRWLKKHLCGNISMRQASSVLIQIQLLGLNEQSYASKG
jgi:hypothetical protein